MELIPSFIVFIVALMWKTDQDTKRHFAEREASAAPERRNPVTENGSSKS